MKAFFQLSIEPKRARSTIFDWRLRSAKRERLTLQYYVLSKAWKQESALLRELWRAACNCGITSTSCSTTTKRMESSIGQGGEDMRSVRCKMGRSWPQCTATFSAWIGEETQGLSGQPRRWIVRIEMTCKRQYEQGWRQVSTWTNRSTRFFNNDKTQATAQTETEEMTKQWDRNTYYVRYSHGFVAWYILFSPSYEQYCKLSAPGGSSELIRQQL